MMRFFYKLGSYGPKSTAHKILFGVVDVNEQQNKNSSATFHTSIKRLAQTHTSYHYNNVTCIDWFQCWRTCLDHDKRYYLNLTSTIR